MRRNDTKSKPDKRQPLTPPPPAPTKAKSANTSERAAKSKPDQRQTSTQPPSVSTEGKSANAADLAAIDDFFELAQRLRLQGYSGKVLADLLIMKFVMRINTLVGLIEKAFAGQPFYPGAPETKANQLRLNAYVTDYALAIKLLGSVIELSKAISSITTAKPTGTGGENDRKT
jgi:hypothetical protein